MDNIEKYDIEHKSSSPKSEKEVLEFLHDEYGFGEKVAQKIYSQVCNTEGDNKEENFFACISNCASFAKALFTAKEKEKEAKSCAQGQYTLIKALHPEMLKENGKPELSVRGYNTLMRCYLSSRSEKPSLQEATIKDLLDNITATQYRNTRGVGVLTYVEVAKYLNDNFSAEWPLE